MLGQRPGTTSEDGSRASLVSVISLVRRELRKPGRAWALLIVLWILVAAFLGWIYAAIWIGGTVLLAGVAIARKSRAPL